MHCQVQHPHQRREPRPRSLPSEPLEETLDVCLRRGRRRLLSLSWEREEEDEFDESDEESESESESLSELEPESLLDDEPEERDDRLARFLALPVSFSLSFSFASKILFAVPLLFLNSSGTSTDGLPSSFNFARVRGFSSCCVRDGRDTYGRVDLHWYVK